MLAPEREGMTTASSAPVVVYGTAAERFQLWMERTGQAPRADLTDVFPVQWGKHNEGFCLDWHARKTKHDITERQRFVTHPTLPTIGGTLDGYRLFDDTVIECKVINPITRSAEVLKYYGPQVLVQVRCRGAQRGALLIQQGNSAPQEYEYTFNDDYEREVFTALMAFQNCVETRTPPSPAPTPPVLPERWATVDLNAEPLTNWGPSMRARLNLWRDTRETAALHEQAKKDVKVLLPDDVGRVHYGDITVKRARNGAVSIVEEAA